MYPVLQRLNEIDQHVPGEDHVEIVERRVCNEIMLKECPPAVARLGSICAPYLKFDIVAQGSCPPASL